MNIIAEKGTKVLFTGKGGYDGEETHALKHLTVGVIYTVEYTIINSWNTEVILQEIPNESFNSVQFDDIAEEYHSDIIESLENKMPVLTIDKHGFENHQIYIDDLLEYIERLKREQEIQLEMYAIAMDEDQKKIKAFDKWIKQQPLFRD